jgi:hypothetical protein
LNPLRVYAAPHQPPFGPQIEVNGAHATDRIDADRYPAVFRGPVEAFDRVTVEQLVEYKVRDPVKTIIRVLNVKNHNLPLI